MVLERDPRFKELQDTFPSLDGAGINFPADRTVYQYLEALRQSLKSLELASDILQKKLGKRKRGRAKKEVEDNSKKSAIRDRRKKKKKKTETEAKKSKEENTTTTNNTGLQKTGSVSQEKQLIDQSSKNESKQPPPSDNNVLPDPPSLSSTGKKRSLLQRDATEEFLEVGDDTAQQSKQEAVMLEERRHKQEAARIRELEHQKRVIQTKSSIILTKTTCREGRNWGRWASWRNRLSDYSQPGWQALPGPLSGYLLCFLLTSFAAPQPQQVLTPMGCFHFGAVLWVLLVLLRVGYADDDPSSTTLKPPECSAQQGCMACLSTPNKNCAYCPTQALCYDVDLEPDQCEDTVVRNVLHCVCLQQSECDNCIAAHEDCIWCGSSPTFSCQAPHARCLYPTQNCELTHTCNFSYHRLCT